MRRLQQQLSAIVVVIVSELTGRQRLDIPPASDTHSNIVYTARARAAYRRAYHHRHPGGQIQRLHGSTRLPAVHRPRRRRRRRLAAAAALCRHITVTELNCVPSSSRLSLSRFLFLSLSRSCIHRARRRRSRSRGDTLLLRSSPARAS